MLLSPLTAFRLSPSFLLVVLRLLLPLREVSFSAYEVHSLQQPLPFSFVACVMSRGFIAALGPLGGLPSLSATVYAICLINFYSPLYGTVRGGYQLSHVIETGDRVLAESPLKLQLRIPRRILRSVEELAV